MRKIKIFITVLVLYEFVMLTILQIPNYCVAFFNKNFCAAYNFKYFFMCVMLPALVGLVIWWLPEIARLFCPNKCQCDTSSRTTQNKDVDKDELSKQYLEKLITSAIMIGVHKFATSHPKTRETLENIISAFSNTQKTKPKKKKK